LPLGEGGSFCSKNSPARKPNVSHENKTSVPLIVPGGALIRSRQLAFAIAAQVYATFGYSKAEAVFDRRPRYVRAREDKGGIAAVRIYLRGTFGFDDEVSMLDYDRGVS
jgi:hypothetical protein